MSGVNAGTMATLREMFEGVMRGENTQASVFGTQAMANALTRGLGLLRKDDASWWGVQLRNELLPESMWTEGERGGTVKVKITMRRAEGKPKGANGKIAFAEGVAVVGRLPTMEMDKIEQIAWENECKMIHFGTFAFSWEEAEKADPAGAQKRREFIEANKEKWDMEKEWEITEAKRKARMAR